MSCSNPKSWTRHRNTLGCGTQFGREQEDDENGILGCQGGVSLRPAPKGPHPSSHKTKPPPPSTEIPSDRFQFSLIRFPAPPKLLPDHG
eukprot:scaffold82574_cov74-Cyclotella_meneghiniana.AAC.2